MPEGESLPDMMRVKPALARLDGALHGFTGSNESEFLEIGNILQGAVGAFRRMADEFAKIAEELHRHGGGSVIDALEGAGRAVAALSVQEGRDAVSMLAQLQGSVSGIDKQLGMLARIVGEIRALAINGKIQAAQVAAAGVDFSVFTKEIGRLGQLAEDSTDQASQRMTDVRSTVGLALQAAAAFEQGEAKELAAVRERIEAGLAAIGERRRAVSATIDVVADRSEKIAQRIAMTVGELQINDNVNQRIEHVREALQTTGRWIVGEVVAHSSLAGVPPGRLRAVASGVFRLCRAQLEGAAADYREEVERLIGNLGGLADDAKRILSDAESVFESGSGNLFVSEIERDIRRASELLALFATGRNQTSAAVGAVSETMAAMGSDLANIRSIDVDLRVMGLNATLKCGRLGSEGRALGVISHELRVCSKRTEDCSRVIFELLNGALAHSRAIATHSETAEKDGAVDSMDRIDSALSALAALGRTLAETFETLRAEGERISVRLSDAAVGIAIHHRLGDTVGDVLSDLQDLRAVVEPAGELDAAGHQDVLDFMLAKYTMNRERVIHRTFAAGAVDVPVDQPSALQAENINDLFL